MAPSAEVTAEALVLVQAQAQARQQIESLTAASLVAEVRAFRGWYSSVEITRFAGRLAKLTAAAQKQTALSTDSFATRILRLLLGRRPESIGAVPVDNLRGVPLESVYGRLADQYRFLTATRGPDARVDEPRARLRILEPDEVLDRVVQRAEVQLGDNLSLAMRDQWAAEMEAAPSSITGFRRIIHPEMSDHGTCGLCAVASDRVYSRDDLLPLHSRCNCTVLALVGEPGGDGDPGHELNQDDLNRLYQAAGRDGQSSTAGADLKRTRVTVLEHGELGPVLRYGGQSKRGPKDAAAAVAKSRTSGGEIKVNAQRVLEVAQATIADLERRTAAGEDLKGPLAFQRGLAKRMRARLAG